MAQQIWNSQNISDQTGKVVIVTGSNSGLGLETTTVLAGKKAKVVMGVRNLAKGEMALNTIKEKFPEADLTLMEIDLSSMSSIKVFADTFKENFLQLDILVNNAGVMVPPYQKTKDGFELQMGTNHFGHFALTGYLIQLLKDTPQSRIVNVSSMAHKAGNLNFDDLNWEKRKYKKWSAYGDSKIANLYFTFALQNKLKQENSHVIVTAAHPGWTATELQRNTGFISILNHVFAQTIPMGTLPTLYAATAKDVEGTDFFGPSGFMEMRGYPKKVGASTRAKDPIIAQKFFKISEELTGVNF